MTEKLLFNLPILPVKGPVMVTGGGENQWILYQVNSDLGPSHYSSWCLFLDGSQGVDGQKSWNNTALQSSAGNVLNSLSAGGQAELQPSPSICYNRIMA